MKNNPRSTDSAAAPPAQCHRGGAVALTPGGSPPGSSPPGSSPPGSSPPGSSPPGWSSPGSSSPGWSSPGSSPTVPALARRRRARTRLPRILLLALLASVSMLAAVAHPALAAGTSQVGQNVGREIASWARAIMLGVAGLVAIPVLARRDVAGGLVLALLVVIVGGFVFAPSTVESVISGLWHAIAG